VEKRFESMAWIGGENKAVLELVRAYATGKHQETTVAAHALKGVIEWRMLPGKDRREFFEKILMYLQGLQSQAHGTDQRIKGAAEQKFNTVKDNGVEALSQLSGEATKFADVDAAIEWWKEGKKKRKWDDYVGPRFRGAKPEAKPAAAEEPQEPKPDDGSGEEEPAEGGDS
jgi:hypothetical protein